MGYVVSGVSLCGNKYRADFRWQDEDGTLSQRIRKLLSSTNRRDAEKEALRLASCGLAPATDNHVKLESAISEYIGSREGAVSPTTLREYRSSLAKIKRASPRFASSSIHEVSATKIRRYESMRLCEGVSPNSVRKEHSLIGAALGMAVEAGQIAANPILDVDPPKKALRAKNSPVRQEAVVSMVSIMQGRIGLAANLAIDAKATACQIAPLTWGDFDDELAEGVLRLRMSPEHGIVTAYRAPMKFAVSDVTRKKLTIERSRMDDARSEDRLFDIAPIALSREFNRVSKALGLECSFSSLRLVERGRACTM